MGIIRKLNTKIRNRINPRRIIVDVGSNYRNSIFLAANARSGSTWVSNIINYNNEYRYMFEPFHCHKVEMCKIFGYRQYLRAENNDEKFTKVARAIVSGNIRNEWIDSHNKRYVSNKRLIKDVRAHHLLKWLHVNFPGVPIILLLRHPCAVANSRIKLNFGTHLEEFLGQDELMQDFIKSFKAEIEGAKTVFEKQIFLWCIENYVPLQQFNKGEIHLAFYENFCENPKKEIARLFSFLGKKFDEKVFETLSNPSRQSRKESAIIAGGNLVDGWRKHVTNDQVKRATEILNIFGLDEIYSQDSRPNVANAYNILSRPN